MGVSVKGALDGLTLAERIKADRERKAEWTRLARKGRRIDQLNADLRSALVTREQVDKRIKALSAELRELESWSC